ncbi:MAG: hypothetical protein C5B55_09445 [Blastocatellia bacterium]|nr:MAG: hypothetical protein C5B55_09445 [Blastocatellia bacterium]
MQYLVQMSLVKGAMDPRAVFGISILMSLVSSVIIVMLFAWPWLRTMNRNDALVRLVAPHMFLRFIGLSFIVPGVVSPHLPSAFAIPAAWGDFTAGVLAIIATIGLSHRTVWAIAAVWFFNIEGALDLLFAFIEGARVQLNPGDLGAAFFIVTAIVPPLLVSHALVFRLLTVKHDRTTAGGKEFE